MQTPGFLVVTASYWAFTLSDGALRMLVLLHLHAQGQTAWALALLLVPYEVAGIVTNLVGGWAGARFGLKPILLLGLLLQVVACLMLTVDAAMLTLGWVMVTQVLSGVAKDFAKTAAKSYVRALAPAAESGPLFRLVALMTGSKNTLKGLGFFVGGALLAAAGFRYTNAALAAGLALALLLSAILLPRAPGKRGATFRGVFAHDAAVNWLAAARLFLFGSRDAWFAVALPLFLVSSWSWTSTWVGAFLALWVIGYGLVQALAPRLVRTDRTDVGLRRTVIVTVALLLPLGWTWAGLHFDLPRAVTLAGLLIYGALFALTSSLHSWLVVALAGADTVVERVGFYYAANAGGRLAGLLLSGYLYEQGRGAGPGSSHGLELTLLASAIAVALAALALLPAARRPVPVSSA